MKFTTLKSLKITKQKFYDLKSKILLMTDMKLVQNNITIC